jgi:hypothetical protein
MLSTAERYCARDRDCARSSTAPKSAEAMIAAKAAAAISIVDSSIDRARQRFRHAQSFAAKQRRKRK